MALEKNKWIGHFSPHFPFSWLPFLASCAIKNAHWLGEFLSESSDDLVLWQWVLGLKWTPSSRQT
jgi:hypothetical protein